MPLPKPLKKLATARRLRSVLTLGDALKVCFMSCPPEQRVKVFSPLLQRQLTIRPGATDVGVMKKVFVNQEYALPFPLRPRVIVDAGANIGMATLYFAHQFPDARIIAIEPEASNFAILRQNCAGLDRIELIQSALWNCPAQVAVKDAGAEKWAFAYENAAPGTAADTSTVTVPQLLDRVGGHIDLLKLDIECAEVELFSDGAAEWLPHVKMIAIELHDRFREGCSRAFYRQICRYPFSQVASGENIFVLLHGETRN
jgi:FkbM family methyltransferase